MAKKGKKGGKKKEKKVEEPPSPYPSRIGVEYASCRPFDNATMTEFEPSISITATAASLNPSAFGLRSPTHAGSVAAAPSTVAHPVVGNRSDSLPAAMSALKLTGPSPSQSGTASTLLLREEVLVEGKQAEMARTASFQVLSNVPNVNTMPQGLQVVMIMRHRDAIQRLKTFPRGARWSSSQFVLEDMRQFPHSLPVQIYGLRAICMLCMSTVSTRDECKREKCDCPQLFSSQVALPTSMVVPPSGGDAAMLSDPMGNRAAMLEAGTIDVINTAISTFGNRNEVILFAYDAMSQMALHPASAELFISKNVIDAAFTVAKTYMGVKGIGPTIVESALTTVWNCMCVNTPDKFTMPNLLPLALPSTAITLASLTSSGPSPATMTALAHAAAFAPPMVHAPQQGVVSRHVASAKTAYLDLLKNVRKAFENNPLDHRIVDRAYCLMMHSAAEIEFAGPEPGKPVEPTEEDGKDKGKDKGGKDKGGKDKKKK